MKTTKTILAFAFCATVAMECYSAAVQKTWTVSDGEDNDCWVKDSAEFVPDYDTDGKAPLSNCTLNATPTSGESRLDYIESSDNEVKVTLTTEFSVQPADSEDALQDPEADAQAAIRLGTNDVDGVCFQIWTPDAEGETNHWVTVAADGVTPVNGNEYTVRIVFDYGSCTYGASVLYNDGYVPLATGDETCSFTLANNENKKLSSVEFRGSTTFTSLVANWSEEGGESDSYEEDEPVTLSDGDVTLTAGQAAWLNEFGLKEDVAGYVSVLTVEQFNSAYLLNLDITGEFGYEFGITGITVGSDKVTIGVSLTRTGACQDWENEELVEPITGTLKIYGANSLTGLKAGGTEVDTLTLGPVGSGDQTAETEIDLGECAYPFFDARIE